MATFGNEVNLIIFTLFGVGLIAFANNLRSERKATIYTYASWFYKDNDVINKNMKVVCYYAIPISDSSDGTVNSNLTPEEIDPFLCTHLIVAFASVKNNAIHVKRDSDYDIYSRVLKLREKNPDLKVLLSLGGGSGDHGFSEMVSSPQNIESFCSSSRDFLLEQGFDGIDLDWEFPAWPFPFRNNEKRLFADLVQKLYSHLKNAPKSLLLTLAVAGPKTIINRSYDIKRLANNVDFVSIMGYDYHIYWNYFPFTGHNAPLKKRPTEFGYFATMNIEWSADYWLEMGMPKDQVVIGIPTYARSWKLFASKFHKVGSLAVSEGFKKGSLTYPDVLEFLSNGAVSMFDKDALVPYAFKNRDWVSYDDPQSLQYKVTYIKENGFPGVMTWNLNCDDWSGKATGEKFILHNVIKNTTLT